MNSQKTTNNFYSKAGLNNWIEAVQDETESKWIETKNEAPDFIEHKKQDLKKFEDSYQRKVEELKSKFNCKIGATWSIK